MLHAHHGRIDAKDTNGCVSDTPSFAVISSDVTLHNPSQRCGVPNHNDRLKSRQIDKAFLFEIVSI